MENKVITGRQGTAVVHVLKMDREPVWSLDANGKQEHFGYWRDTHLVKACSNRPSRGDRRLRVNAAIETGDAVTCKSCLKWLVEVKP